MKMNKKFALLALGLFSTVLISGCGQAKIGYIDVDKVSEAPQLKAIEDENTKKITEAQQELMKKFEENPNMSQEESQKAQMEARRKLQGLQQSAQLQVRQQMDVALRDVAKEKELDAILLNSVEQPIAISGCVNVTDDAVQKLQ